jgi:hypothetical protein
MSDNAYIAVNDVHAAVQQRFFPESSSEDYYQRRSEDILRKLLRDAGIVLPKAKDQRDRFYEQTYRPPPALRFGSYSADSVLEMLDMLLDPEHRSPGTYVRAGATRGITRINLLPSDYVEHLFLTIEEGLQRRGNIASLPRPPATPRELAPCRADLLYPDEDGRLKRAFCDGMGVDPDSDPRGFVELFRHWVFRALKRNESVTPKPRFRSVVGQLAEPETAELIRNDEAARIALNRHYETILDSVLYDCQHSSIFARTESIRVQRPMTENIARICGTLVLRGLNSELAQHYGIHYHPPESSISRPAELVIPAEDPIAHNPQIGPSGSRD